MIEINFKINVVPTESDPKLKMILEQLIEYEQSTGRFNQFNEILKNECYKIFDEYTKIFEPVLKKGG